MIAAYPARYKDSHGEERTVIRNDGRTLTMVIRGVLFEGNDFDALEPKDSPDAAQLSSFTLPRIRTSSARHGVSRMTKSDSAGFARNPNQEKIFNHETHEIHEKKP